MTLRVAIGGLSAGIALALLLGCGGGGGSGSSLTTTPPPSTPDFTLSASPSTLNITRSSSANVQVTVTPQHGFTGTVTVIPGGLPDGVTASPVDIVAGSTGTVAVNVSTSTGTGPFSISFTGTSGALSHSASLTLTVPLGGGVLTFVPRTSGDFALPQNIADYFRAIETDVAPVRLKDCGSASSSLEFDIIASPQDGTSTHTEGSDHYVSMYPLPSTIPANGAKNYADYSVYETAHAIQYDLLHNVTHRGTEADIEGFSQACTDLVYRDLAFSGKGVAPKDGGSDNMLLLDTFRKEDPAAIAAASWVNLNLNNAYFQSVMAIGEASFLLAASQKGPNGINGFVAHENAIFGAESVTDAAHPLTPSDRRRAWDATGLTFDGQSAGQWMSEEMIQDPVFDIGKPELIAHCSPPQYCTDLMVQSLAVTSVSPSANPTEAGGIPTVAPVTSGPLTITVKDASGRVVLGPIQADLSQTSVLAPTYSLDLPRKVGQGAYTVIINATVNGAALEQRFAAAVIPSTLIGAGNGDLAFPGQYLVAVDSAGNANGGSLTVTRGKTVFTMTGFAIVKPDSTGTFDVTGPSGTKHTYTAPEPWARFIPVE